MNKLSISSIDIKNFMSYGDYNTHLDLDNLGPVLIVGNKDDADSFQESNGSGKSTITTALIWCLFGRTFSRDKPGDKVINWDSGQNCVVTIKTTDGWEITRTRKTEGCNELSVMHNGDDKTLSTTTNTQQFINDLFGLDYDIFISSTFFGQFSKPFLDMPDARRKAALERLLNLDRLNIWSSVAKSKMDKTESALTKLSVSLDGYQSELSRLNDQLQSTKSLKDEYDKSKEIKIADLIRQKKTKETERDSIIVPDIDRLKIRWDAIRRINEKVKEYQSQERSINDKITRNGEQITSNNTKISRYTSQMQGNTKYNIAQLEKEHIANNKLLEDKSSISSKISILKSTLLEKQTALNNLVSTIDEWKSASGTICVACKQTITGDYAYNMTSPLLDSCVKIRSEISAVNKSISDLESTILNMPKPTKVIAVDDAKRINTSIQSVSDEIDRTNVENGKLELEIGKLKSDLLSISSMLLKVIEQAKQSTPNITIEEAIKTKMSKDLLDQVIASLSEQIKSLEAESNPHNDTIKMIKSQIDDVSAKVTEAGESKSKLNALYTHLYYIKSAYGDRNKIKQYILTNVMPVLNRRIQYYLEAFDCDFGIEFTPALSMLPSKWDYDFCSGGERKRIDMAIMFALHDLYINIYGQQCNMMILDEVDGALDSKGVELFAEIVANDFCGASDARPKPDTVLIISHKNDLLDAFPSKIFVRKKGAFSHIESNI